MKYILQILQQRCSIDPFHCNILICHGRKNPLLPLITIVLHFPHMQARWHGFVRPINQELMLLVTRVSFLSFMISPNTVYSLLWKQSCLTEMYIKLLCNTMYLQRHNLFAQNISAKCWLTIHFICFPYICPCSKYSIINVFMVRFGYWKHLAKVRERLWSILTWRHDLFTDKTT